MRKMKVASHTIPMRYSWGITIHLVGHTTVSLPLSLLSSSEFLFLQMSSRYLFLVFLNNSAFKYPYAIKERAKSPSTCEKRTVIIMLISVNFKAIFLIGWNMEDWDWPYHTNYLENAWLRFEVKKGFWLGSRCVFTFTSTRTWDSGPRNRYGERILVLWFRHVLIACTVHLKIYN